MRMRTAIMRVPSLAWASGLAWAVGFCFSHSLGSAARRRRLEILGFVVAMPLSGVLDIFHFYPDLWTLCLAVVLANWALLGAVIGLGVAFVRRWTRKRIQAGRIRDAGMDEA